MAITLIVFLGYGILANRVSNLVMKKRKIMKYLERCFAGIFAGLAVKLAFEDK